MANAARMLTDAIDFGHRPSGAAPCDAGDRPIDLVHLARQTMGDRALELELLRMFERQAGHIVEQIESSPGARQQCDLAHTLTGSARAVGAVEVAAAARAYEDCLEATPGHADDKLKVLRGSVVRARAAIADLLADR